MNSVVVTECESCTTGPAEVSTFFVTEADKQDPAVLSASFRGRRLRGSVIQLPEKYSGTFCRIVLEISLGRVRSVMCLLPGFAIRKRPIKRSGAEEGEAYEAVSKFRKLTYWNHDANPSQSDGMPMLMEWLDVASVLHSARPSKLA